MARSIAWDKATQADVLRAIKEYDRLGPERFFSAQDSLLPRLMSSPRANALPPVISRAGRPVPSRCSQSLDSPSNRNEQRKAESHVSMVSARPAHPMVRSDRSAG
jgi:hypothetical protein